MLLFLQVENYHIVTSHMKNMNIQTFGATRASDNFSDWVNLLITHLQPRVFLYGGKDLPKRFPTAYTRPALNKLRAPIRRVQNPRGIKYVDSDTPR